MDRTLDLLKPFLMQTTHLGLLLLEDLQARRQRESNLKVRAVAGFLVISPALGVIE